MEDNVYVLGVDPGTTTGLALVLFGQGGNPALVWSEQLGWDEATDEIAYRLREMRMVKGAQLESTRVVAVGEKFMINSKTAQRGQAGAEDALGMLGVLRREARRADVEHATPQQASPVKALVSDGALRLLRLYSPGLKHCNDASRHAVFWALQNGLLRPRRLLR